MVKGKSFSILNLLNFLFLNWLYVVQLFSKHRGVPLKYILGTTYNQISQSLKGNIWSEDLNLAKFRVREHHLFFVLQKQPFNNHACIQSCLVLIKREKNIDFFLYQFVRTHKMLQRCSYFLENCHSYMSYT